jgi:hypothetical protein
MTVDIMQSKILYVTVLSILYKKKTERQTTCKFHCPLAFGFHI